jgi:hypothetical protein
MASFTITGFASSPQTLNPNEFGVITADGLLVVDTGSSAVVMNGDGSDVVSRLAVLGTIIRAGSDATSGAVYVNTNAYASISVGPEGAIIGGAASAIYGDSPSGFSRLDVRNSGFIDGERGITTYDKTSVDISNSGTISGHLTGIRVENSTLHVTNTGTIRSSNIAIVAMGQGTQVFEVIDNSGTIAAPDTTALYLSDGVSIVRNSGSINGYIYLYGGDDTFEGALGYQFHIDGGIGDDTIVGGANGEVLVGGEGADVIDGNGGIDTLSFADSFAGGVNVDVSTGTGFGGDASGDTYENIENVIGTQFRDTLTGSSGNNRLDGRGGADTLLGGAGNDTLIVDNAGDIVVEEAGGGTDRVGASVTYALAAGQHVERMSTTNSAGTNTIHLTGNEFAQEMTGNAGNNWLTGGGGRDVMTGGRANDTFDFNAVGESGTGSSTRDVIVDFTDSGGEQDRINVATIDANTIAGGNNAFVLDTNGSFSTGEIRQVLVNGGADLLLEFNNDGDASADMSILLMGRTTLLDNADFVF